MRISHVMVVVFTLLASGHTQDSPDFYIASLQMPCYPPLARLARVQGQAKVQIDVGKDGTVTSAEAIEGNAILKAPAVSNLRTWKFSVGQGGDPSRRTTVLFEYKLEGDPLGRGALHV
jgi:TonB family protein